MNPISRLARKFIDAAGQNKAAETKKPITDKQGNYYLGFGKFRNTPLQDIDTSYLKWVLNNCDKIDEELFAAIELEVWSRYERE